MNPELIKQVIDKYGVDAQVDMVIEECSELQKALLKYRRNPQEHEYNNVLEEVADVEIMLEQLRFIMGKGAWIKIETFKVEKLERLYNKLNNETI